jgi:hypothetical protein
MRRLLLECSIAAIGLLLSAASSPANAAVWCAGQVTDASISSDGYLRVDWGFGQLIICNVNADSAPPAPNTPMGFKTCQALYSSAMTALAAGKELRVLLPNDSTCSNLANFANGWPAKALYEFNVHR